MVFKSQKTGKVEQITAADIETANWLRVARGFGLKLILKDGLHFRFDGFREPVCIDLYLLLLESNCSVSRLCRFTF